MSRYEAPAVLRIRTSQRSARVIAFGMIHAAPCSEPEHSGLQALHLRHGQNQRVSPAERGTGSLGAAAVVETRQSAHVSPRFV